MRSPHVVDDADDGSRRLAAGDDASSELNGCVATPFFSERSG
jgi:hypothetical protein